MASSSSSLSVTPLPHLINAIPPPSSSHKGKCCTLLALAKRVRPGNVLSPRLRFHSRQILQPNLTPRCAATQVRTSSRQGYITDLSRSGPVSQASGLKAGILRTSTSSTVTATRVNSNTLIIPNDFKIPTPYETYHSSFSNANRPSRCSRCPNTEFHQNGGHGAISDGLVMLLGLYATNGSTIASDSSHLYLGRGASDFLSSVFIS